MELRFKRFENPHSSHYEVQRASTLSGWSDNSAAQNIVSTEAIQKFDQHFETSNLLAEEPGRTFEDKPVNNTTEFETFRLISSKLPPRPISLRISPPTIRSQPPSAQDSSEQRHLRRSQARQAAIEAQAIDTPPMHTNLSDNAVKTFDIATSMAPAVALVIPRDSSEVVKAKVAILHTTHSSGTPIKKKRKRFKPKQPRLRPAFFRPTFSMGRRATGYAYGYQGSWAVADPSKVPYTRDKMKHGHLANQ